MTCRNYTNSSNDNNRFQDNLMCSSFTVCNLNLPFARDVTLKKIAAAVALKILPRTGWNDYVNRLAWEHLGILLEVLEEVPSPG